MHAAFNRNRWIAKHKVLVALALFILTSLVLFALEAFRRVFGRNVSNCAKFEEIDVVYTWVNGSDPKFLEDLRRFSKRNTSEDRDISKQRFSDKYELKFSLRSLEKYAPWVRHVYVVTNGQIPYWLNLDYERVTVISHEQIFTDSYDLPSFSSPAIESHLHRIPGLSQRFVYFNDDIFLGAPTYPEDFRSASRGFLIYMAWPLPTCATDCPWMYVADGECDASCYNADCQMDGGDCDDRERTFVFDSVTLESGEIVETDYEGEEPGQRKSFMKNLFSATEEVNLTDLVGEHNRRVMYLNKMSRRKFSRKKIVTDSTPIERTRRSSFDAYGASLQHSNRVFNKRYGFAARQVPAHAPIMIDGKIMEELQSAFQKEFQVTSRNRFRHGDDMQFAFSYYYYLIHEQRTSDVAQIFDRFDTDESGTWSDREIRTLLAKLFELPLTYRTVDQLEYLLFNCSKLREYPEVSTPEFERYVDSRLPTVSKEIVTNCPVLTDLLTKRFGKVPKYKHHILKNSESSHVTFKMLSSNVTDVVGHLDEIRRQTKKFVCLNDNLDDTRSSENELVKAVLYDFYLSLFPKASKFELPSDLRNRFLYVDELETWKNGHFKIKLCVYFFVAVLCYVTFCNLCRIKYVCRIVNKLMR